jgi:hypothetical protein
VTLSLIAASSKDTSLICTKLDYLSKDSFRSVFINSFVAYQGVFITAEDISEDFSGELLHKVTVTNTGGAPAIVALSSSVPTDTQFLVPEPEQLSGFFMTFYPSSSYFTPLIQPNTSFVFYLRNILPYTTQNSATLNYSIGGVTATAIAGVEWTAVAGTFQRVDLSVKKEYEEAFSGEGIYDPEENARQMSYLKQDDLFPAQLKVLNTGNATDTLVLRGEQTAINSSEEDWETVILHGITDITADVFSEDGYVFENLTSNASQTLKVTSTYLVDAIDSAVCKKKFILTSQTRPAAVDVATIYHQNDSPINTLIYGNSIIGVGVTGVVLTGQDYLDKPGYFRRVTYSGVTVSVGEVDITEQVLGGLSNPPAADSWTYTDWRKALRLSGFVIPGLAAGQTFDYTISGTLTETIYKHKADEFITPHL